MDSSKASALLVRSEVLPGWVIRCLIM